MRKERKRSPVRFRSTAPWTKVEGKKGGEIPLLDQEEKRKKKG